MNNFELWNSKVQEYSKLDSLRKGQIYMNALADVDINLYRTITDSEYDCFYDNGLCESFLIKLMEEWK